MPEIGWPPLLRVRHQRMQVLDHGIEVEALEFFCVVEGFAHRIGRRVIAMQHADIQLLRPPVAVAVSALAACKRTFACALVIRFCVHCFSPMSLDWELSRRSDRAEIISAFNELCMPGKGLRP